MAFLVAHEHGLREAGFRVEAEPPRRAGGEEVLGAGQRAQQRFHQHQPSYEVGPAHRQQARGRGADVDAPTAAEVAPSASGGCSASAASVPASYPPDFSELLRRMPGVSRKMLSVTLRNLTRDGLVARRVEPTVPPQVHYRLTELGLSLEAALAVVRAWVEERMAETDRADELRGHDEASAPARPVGPPANA